MSKWQQLVKRLQTLMNSQGESLTVDGDPGPKTIAALEHFEFDLELTRSQVPQPVDPVTGHAENPAYLEAKKYEGQGESTPKFVTWLSGFWLKLTGLHYKTIIGSSFAWCALFVVTMQSQVGQKYIGSAGAKDQRSTGVAIEWRTNGIPKGAIVGINHNGDCTSESNNHVTFADGDCTPEDLAKPDAQFPGYGGNQSNEVKRSMYPAKDICAVRWPIEVAKPGKITKSIGCIGVDQGKESTQ